MKKNLYDSDVSIFSPEGKILQLEYAHNATNVGTIKIGIKTFYHLFFGVFNMKNSNIGNHSNKICSIGENIGFVISGILGDGKYVHNYLEKIKKEYEQGNNRIVLVSWLVLNCSRLFYLNTFSLKSRPYGVNVFLGGYDFNGPKLYQIKLNGIVEKKNIIIMGSIIQTQIQPVKNFLEFTYPKIKFSSLDEIFQYLIFSIHRNSMGGRNPNILEKNSIIAFLGKNIEIVILNSKSKNFFLEVLTRKNLKSFINNTKNYIFENINKNPRNFCKKSYWLSKKIFYLNLKIFINKKDF